MDMDYDNCLYVEECGPLVEQSIHYVAVPPAVPVGAGFEETFEFLSGQINPGDPPIFVVLKSNNDDLKIGIITMVPKVVPRPYTQDFVRPGHPTELISWKKGDIQLKVKLLVPYITGNAVRSFFLAVKTPTQTISLDTVISMPNCNNAGITRFNYLNLGTVRTRMLRNDKSEYRDVYKFSEDIWDMINTRLALD